MDWQRHYAYLAQLLEEGARLKSISPGVTRHGEDVGRWLATQLRDWALLNAEQQGRLDKLGVTPARFVPAHTAPTKRAGKPSKGASRPPLSTWSGKAAAHRDGDTSNDSRTAASTGQGCGWPTNGSAATGSTPSSSKPSPNSDRSGPTRDRCPAPGC
ncbi:helicase associated domain-containing protein [Streptomyces sp. NPDC002033]|uniref:helicase associated domain-containing protein n=1 Tax=unclassified Streptomyces TaxID=2593676 RepID=UPI00332BF699